MSRKHRASPAIGRLRRTPTDVPSPGPSNPHAWLGRVSWTEGVSLALTGSALLLWTWRAQQADPGAMNDLGVVSVLDPWALLALAVVAAAFCLALALPRLRPPIAALHLVSLIVMLYGVTTVMQEMPRFHVSWRHIGIAEFIARTGTIDPTINAYFNWPGFFVLTAFFSEVLGWESAYALTWWAPVYFNLLYLGPLYLLARAATSNQRLIWLSIWFFYLSNWVGQDYFSPQALNYFFFLVVAALLVLWFQTPGVRLSFLPRAWRQAAPVQRFLGWLNRHLGHTPLATETNATQRIGLFLLMMLIFLAIVPSHQLTPFFVLVFAGALVVADRCALRGLPLLFGVLVAGWITFMTTAYLAGHLDVVVGSVGEINENVNASVVERLAGSPEHIFVVRVRVVMTLLIGLLALAGFGRRWWSGRFDLPHLFLMVAPFSLVVLQPYGGEMILRAQLFALPGMAFLAAAAFLPTPAWSARHLGAIAAISLVMIGGFLFTRYGNERMDYYTEAEVAAVCELYRLAPPGSLLLAGAENLPWDFQAVEQYRTQSATGDVQRQDLAAIAERMRSDGQAFFILSRSQKAFAELFLGAAPGAWDAVEAQMAASAQFRVLFRNQDATIFTLSDSNAAAPPAASAAGSTVVIDEICGSEGAI